ncbi:alkyl sulfatase dimerization domain-containing protein [Rhodococcus sp. (in: high G+C Gram-positive bacteria)]|uniref:alkyl sulfatase dimerization domain-containing protein n=1 Tax=Rhodococcus sp. TaxID=1831 RepID=UPI003B8A9415
MNEGDLPDELVAKVTLPPALEKSEWLGDFYGGVPHAVREIYVGELGWFDADPTTLAPIHCKESSRRYIDLIGGRDRVVTEAGRVAEGGDHQWAAELLRHVVRADPADREARSMKADALRRVGYTTTTSNWRNFYLTAARELDGTIDYSLAVSVDAPDQVAAMPVSALLEGLRFRIDPAKASEVSASASFRVTDTNDEIGLIVRNGVVEPVSTIPVDAAFVTELSKRVVMSMLFTDLYDGQKKAVNDARQLYSSANSTMRRSSSATSTEESTPHHPGRPLTNTHCAEARTPRTATVLKQSLVWGSASSRRAIRALHRKANLVRRCRRKAPCEAAKRRYPALSRHADQ